MDKKKEVLVDEELRHCIIMLGDRWNEKELNLELRLDQCSILSDPDLLIQIWTNLIDNAIKYSKPGGTIWILEEVDSDYLKVIIKDEGVGISVDKLSKVFDKFYQCDESHKRRGSGLGLSIVRRIIELLEGSIVCESKEGKGTTMTVMIPVR
ncbi:MAG: ATP-binding protein [Mobilitalea sp.]